MAKQDWGPNCFLQEATVGSKRILPKSKSLLSKRDGDALHVRRVAAQLQTFQEWHENHCQGCGNH